MDAQNTAINGVLDTLPPDRAQERSWNYVTLGLGHEGGATFWARFAYALAVVGYDAPVTIEHEDVLVSFREGVRRAADMLRSVVVRDVPDWRPARI